MQELSRGAEAVIYADLSSDTVVKDRIKKGYRLEKLDSELRTGRTKREAKILEKLKIAGINVPKIIRSEETRIVMELIKGKQLKEVLDKKNFRKFAKIIAESVSVMHDQNIIHGDLTTSNMILEDKTGKVFFIDFGLSFVSTKIEDKAVDLHLFRQAIESKHFEFFESMYREFLNDYNPKDRKEVLERLEKVEERGRNKHKF